MPWTATSSWRSARAGLELLEDLELFRGQLVLTRALVGLGQPVVRLRQGGLQPRGVLQLLNRFLVPLLVREENPELEEALRELWIEGNRSSELRFNLSLVGRRRDRQVDPSRDSSRSGSGPARFPAALSRSAQAVW